MKAKAIESVEQLAHALNEHFENVRKLAEGGDVSIKTREEILDSFLDVHEALDPVVAIVLDQPAAMEDYKAATRPFRIYRGRRQVGF